MVVCAQASKHAQLVGAVVHSWKLSEAARHVLLGKQARPPQQNAGTARKEDLAPRILQEQDSAILVHLVTSNQQKPLRRPAQVVPRVGRKRVGVNPLAKIWAASSLKTVVTTNTGYPTKARLVKAP